MKKIHNTDSIGWYIFYYEEKDYKSAYEFYKNVYDNNIDLHKLNWCAESLKWCDKGMEINSEDFRPYRNKFDTLLKLNMIEEIQELVSKYPEHFKTKYYREKMEEITNNAPECVVYTLQTFLQNQSCHRQVTI